MTRHFRIDECDISFLGVEVEKALAKNSYDRLRDAQNEEWAQETVVKGNRGEGEVVRERERGSEGEGEE